jgi:3-(methylsulfanyl)propanoyl-CoA dehydrogenase
MTFSIPAADIRFAFEHISGGNRLYGHRGFPDFDSEIFAAAVNEIGKFCAAEIVPLNRRGDTEGVSLAGEDVRTAAGFKEAYAKYVAGGWNSLAFPHEIGGQGLPSTLAVILGECLSAGALAFSTLTTLTTGAAKAIRAVSDGGQHGVILTRLVSGEWAAAMDLTEPQAGSDLTGIRTSAERRDDGTYKICGQKIFITYGDHDITENIIHLVLARLPDAPAGTAGISMFVVPKFLVQPDGSCGERNDVRCVGLEEKLGIHGSPTATMNFGDRGECIGTLLGEENRGLRNMFIMMNSARLDVGVQGVGIAERSFQAALAFALERRQGRSAGSAPGMQAPIIQHPDVRRMLFSMKSLTEAARAICYVNAVCNDLACSSDQDKERGDAAALAELLTPVSKAWSSERANEVASLGVQIHGGAGYIEETGVAQYLRDARILPIYEGTNGIQAIDLVTRKLPADDGRTVLGLIQEIRRFSAAVESSSHAPMRRVARRLREAADGLQKSTRWILDTISNDPEALLACATPYLRQFGNVAGGYFLACGVNSALHRSGNPGVPSAYLGGKITLTQFFAENYLTEASALAQVVTAPAAIVGPIEPQVLFGY